MQCLIKCISQLGSKGAVLGVGPALQYSTGVKHDYILVKNLDSNCFFHNFLIGCHSFGVVIFGFLSLIVEL